MPILIIICALAALCFIIIFVCYLLAFYSPLLYQNDYRRMPYGNQYAACWNIILKYIDELEAMPCERVAIRSSDGLNLAGRLYVSSETAPVAICFHGYRGCGIRDFCAAAPYLMKLGFSVLIVDERAQGESSGHTITFGIKESDDCKEWIQYVLNRFGGESSIALVGTSMGASTVLLAAGKDLPPNVKCIAADSPYSSAMEIIKNVLKMNKLPAGLFYPLLRFGARLFGGIRLDDCDVRPSIERTKLPMLIVHGEADGFVSCDMSKKLHSEYPDKFELEIFPNAGHVLSYFQDSERYERVLSEFLEKYCR